MDADIPEGYLPVDLGPDFNGLIGPFYAAAFPDGIRLGVRLSRRHLNPLGTAHGGAIAAIADMTGLLVQQLAGYTARATPTISLTMQFLDRSSLGEWIDLRPKLVRQTRSLLFTDSGIHADDRLIATSTAIFKVGPPTQVPFATLGHFFHDNFPGSVPEPVD